MTRPILLPGFLILAYLCGFQAENAFLQYWEDHVSHSFPPHQLIRKASLLSLHQVTAFMKLIEKNELSSHLHSFCKQANIACSTNTLVNKKMDDKTQTATRWNIAIIVYETSPLDTPLSISKEGGVPFFRESKVKEGATMFIPNLNDPMSYTSFLPRPLASKIPFSFSHIDGLKKIFNVVDESQMDEYIHDTLQTCERNLNRGELSTCVTSAKDLIDFAVDKLGHHIQIWISEGVEGSNENVTIGAVKLIHGNLSEPPVLCHSQPFPFQVYYCHVLQKIKVYAVDIYTQKKENHLTMACHHDTSTWNPKHHAFQLLGFGPGQIEVCHWINENGMIWTKNIS